jgi:zinc finger SWIM domain-containing protein 3
MRKIAEKLKGYAQYKGIKNAMKNCVYDSLLVDDFVGWTTFIDKYGLGENVWSNTIFKERERWVPCYLKHEFWAGMSTTQRSESINAFFDDYINARTSLSEFFESMNAYFWSSSTTISCGSNSTIERQLQVEYTHAKYMEIQVEFRGKCNCYFEGVTILGFTSTNTALEESIVCGKPNESRYCVDFNCEDSNVKCTCLLFEFRGILCRHSLFVLG